MEERELIMICGVCQGPIADHKGWLWVDRAAVNAHARAARQWTKEHEEEPGGAVSFGIAEILNYPERVAWKAHHGKCDTDPDAGAYTIDSERISTWADLAHWTAHLMGKSWLSSTDWEKILEGVADGAGSRLRPVNRSKLHA